jgi:hypothetical protein
MTLPQFREGLSTNMKLRQIIRGVSMTIDLEARGSQIFPLALELAEISKVRKRH